MESINLVKAISTFLPNLSSLTAINGLGTLTVPMFGFSMATGRLPDVSTIQMLEVQHPKLSILNLLPNAPGPAFITDLRTRHCADKSKSEGKPCSFTLMGSFLQGGFSLHRIPQLKGRQPNLLLASLIETIFSSFHLESVKLPESLSSFTNALVHGFSIDLTQKTAEITVDLGQIKLLKGIIPKQSLVNSRQTSLSLSIVYDTKPFSWFMNATSVGTFFGTRGRAYVWSLWKGFKFTFTAKDLPVLKLLSWDSSAGMGKLSELMREFGMLDLSIQDLAVSIMTEPLTAIMQGSVRVGQILPRLRCEFMGLKMFSNESSYTFAMESNSIKLSDVVKTFLKFDISDVPFFGSLQIPGVTMMLKPKNFSMTEYTFPDSWFSQLAKQAHASRRSLLLTFPLTLQAYTLNVTSALNRLEIDLQVEPRPLL